MKKILSLALSACLIACMIPAMAFAGTSGYETESNDVKSTANVVEPSGSITGSLAHQKDVDYYKVTALADGYITVNFDTTYTDKKFRLGVYVADASKESYLKRDIDQSMTTPKIPVKAGQDVYVKVYPESWDNEFWAPIGLNYTVKFDQTGSKFWEGEGNDKKSGAKSMTSGSTYYGNLYIPGEGVSMTDHCVDKDYWRYKMPSDGKISFAFKPASIDYEADEIGSGWKISVYTSTGTDPIYQTVAKGDKVVSPNFGFKKGQTLYVKVEADNTYITWSPDYLDYTVKPSFTKSTAWENEKNGTRSTAKKMTLGKVYYGNIANTVALPADITWDRDYFKVTAPRTGKMKIYFGNKSAEYDAKDGWNLQIRTSSKVLKTVKGVTKKYSSTKSVATVNVKKGQTIYVRVSCPENYWRAPAPDNVDYKLKVK